VLAYYMWQASPDQTPEFAPHDRAANARMDQKIYHRRSLVKTVISVLKHGAKEDS